MIMKTTYNILMAGLLSALAFTSCEGFLDKFPETALSPETFYTNEKELTLATNGFYAMLPKPDDSFDGALQDNDLQFHLSLSSIQRGTRQAETETWSASTWSDLRSINYYLEHSVKCTNEDVRKKYDGIAYFFRAVFYYEKVRKYGDIPFYDHVISDSDKESLYRPRDSRGFVMQKIMEDLDRAIDGLPVSWSEGVYRINKYAAYALKSRIALFEGTWRKYHDIADESYTKEDGTTITLSSSYFLQLAADAAKAVMESGKYRMYNGATIVKGQPYRDYFVLEDAETSETILSRRFLYTAEMNELDGKPFYGVYATDVATGKKVCYEVDDTMKFWIMWNDHGDKGYFCPEPMSWNIDAPNLSGAPEITGYTELAPGESKTVKERIFTMA